ncbi:MAG: cystathionine gamma-lyase, partial [Mesorhizobium sp.]
MSETARSRAAALPHMRRGRLAMGDPIPLPLTMAAIFHAPGDATGFDQYGRFSNPTWDAVEHMLAHQEGAPCVAFPSGMAAISAVFFGLLKSGDRILLPSDGYHT